MGMDFRGDPASALLEALDPEQNNILTTMYMTLIMTSQKCCSLTTANVQYAIPASPA